MACALVAVATPASAQQVTVVDEARDASAPGLDITSGTFRNNDHAVVTSATFTRDRRGDVVIAVKARRGPLVGIVSRHRGSGADNTFLINRGGDKVPCRGLTGDWDRDAATLRLRMPAKCLADGNYGAVRFFALTERSGADVDYAPEKRNGDIRFTAWTPRG